MEEESSRNFSWKWIGVGVFIGILVIATLFVSFSMFSGSSNIFTRFINPPRPEIISKYGHDGFHGLNYVFFVDVTVRNNGGEGWIKVFADMEGAGRYEKKDVRIWLGSSETKKLTFTFDVSFLGTLFSLGNLKYRAWATSD